MVTSRARSAQTITLPLALIVARQGPLPGILRGLLATIPEVGATTSVSDTRSALIVVAKFSPAIVLLDFDLMRHTAGSLLREVRVLSPNTRCLILTSDVQQQEVAAEAGADAALLKGCRAPDLVTTVQALMRLRVDAG